MSSSQGPPRRVVRQVSVGLGVFIVVLLSLQMFLLVVGVDALLVDDSTLAWTAAGFSAFLALGSVSFYRYLR